MFAMAPAATSLTSVKSAPLDRVGFMFLRISLLILGLAPSVSAQTLNQAPGTSITIDLNSLPAPYATASTSNSSRTIPLPPLPNLRVPAGFAVNAFASGLAHARSMRIAPNGDVFLAQSGANRITLLRDADGDGRADVTTTFAQGFRFPHGMALHGDYLYVADLDAVWRVPYVPGATSGGARQRVTAQGALGEAGGHATRNLVIDPTGTKMYVAIGSRGNIEEEASPRATIQEFNLDGSGQRTFASGLRNPVGIAFRPGSGEIFTTVNERDGLGDELVPDYLTRVQDNGFYGWPYSYMGSRVQPRPGGWTNAQAQALISRAIVPDLPIRSHSAPLGFAFYDKAQFPAAYRGGAFIALHGSWNAAEPRGYMVVYAPFTGGRPAGSYQVFLSNFWTATDRSAQVIGRPADVAVAADGALLVADDVSNTIWRVAHIGAHTRYNTVYASASTARQSLLQFYNAGAAAASVTITFRNRTTGERLASWLSPPIAPGASRHFGVAQIQPLASPSLAQSQLTEFSAEISSSFDGFTQHVVWDNATGVVANMSRCEGAVSADGHVLLNVAADELSGYASIVRIHNGSGSDRAPTVSLLDAVSGVPLATYTAPVISNLAALEVSMNDIAAAATPTLADATGRSYSLVLDSNFGGSLQHLVRMPAGNIVEFSAKCPLVGAAN